MRSPRSAHVGRWPGRVAALAVLLAAGLVARPLAAQPAPAPATAASPPRAMAGGYLGAAACGACHPAALAAWQASGHARAAAALVADERARRSCQACHATGDAPAAPAVRLGVECEACHGAGEAYTADDVMRDPALAAALGLRPLATPAARAALCLGCHDVAAFDVEAAWRRIAH